MKKILLGAAILLSGLVYAAAPNEKILKCFNSTFPKAENVSWSETPNDYQVQFSNGIIKCKIWYDADGNVLKTIRYYFGESLSPFILAKLQQKYADKKIFGVTEVSSEEGLTYYIVLEDDKKWYDVTSDSVGNISLQNKYNKA